jgi:hypothetical protein
VIASAVLDRFVRQAHIVAIVGESDRMKDL